MIAGGAIEQLTRKWVLRDLKVFPVKLISLKFLLIQILLQMLACLVKGIE
jgi:hypothetical protein